MPPNKKKLCYSKFPRRLFYNQPKKILLWNSVRKVFPYTHIGYASLCQTYDAIKDLNKKNISGSVVEMGCYKGGCGAFMASVARDKRKVWLFDSFEGIPEPSQEDIKKAQQLNLPLSQGKEMRAAGDSQADIEDVYEVCNTMKVKPHIIKGWFQDTLPSNKAKIGTIALLRLDADLYESTKFCLEELYDQVADGGYIIIDDYLNWEGARRACYEFFFKRHISPHISYYPYGGSAFFIKNKPDL